MTVDNGVWLGLVGVLGVLVGASLAGVGALCLRWIRGHVQPHLQRFPRRVFLALALVVSWIPPKLAGVDLSRPADWTPAVVYLIGLVGGVIAIVGPPRRGGPGKGGRSSAESRGDPDVDRRPTAKIDNPPRANQATQPPSATRR
jgi:hypothetical protein